MTDNETMSAEALLFAPNAVTVWSTISKTTTRSNGSCTHRTSQIRINLNQNCI
jgi:hypothetical protein